MRVVVESVLARRSGLSPTDAQAHLGDERLGVLLAHLPEAGTGKPGYEAYEECPAGWSVASSNQDHGAAQQDICVQIRDTCPSGFGGRDGCEQAVTMPRPLRQDPYYFDIRHDDGNVTRHWFNLHR
ncbi:hypothetical protein [Aquibium oceanicum]|uniref:hypothetical protein n=1 Tax=Aquibium oceanicum TaxID=1670800 RepID=UPI001F257EF7|nr:hypothetical protein [Aquibium oceanicum]